MSEEHDEREIRCRRLGHKVAFKYCRREANGRLCGRILDCWWEQFDVRDYLQRAAPQELAELLARAPHSKVASIVELIEQAKRAEGH